MFHYDVDDKKNLGLDIDESWRGEGDPRFLENPGMADPRPPFVPGPLLAGGHIAVNALGFGRLTSDDEGNVWLHVKSQLYKKINVRMEY